MNTSNDSTLIDEEGNIIDKNAVMCYIVFRRDNTQAAYLPMAIDSYNRETREFTFTGSIKTTDYITEQESLEITSGLFKVGQNSNYNSVIDYKDAQFDVYFMYKYDDVAMDYRKSDTIFQLLPESRSAGYVLMCAYYNNPNNLYNLVLEYSKFTSSPVLVEPYTETTLQFSVGAVPFLEYEYGIENVINMYDTFEHMATVYLSLIHI